jgi:hypothetical protein
MHTMTLNSRPCMLGSSINSRVEIHGDENVPALDIPLSAIMLTGTELNALLQEPYAHSALFNERTNPRALVEPLFKQLHPLKLKDKFEESSVTLVVGLNRKTVTLNDVKLAKLTLQPLVGGLTALKLIVQCTPTLDDGITTLLAFMNHDADVEITIGERVAPAQKQSELPLSMSESPAPGPGVPGDDDGDDDEEELEEDDKPEPVEAKAKRGRPAKITPAPSKRKPRSQHPDLN